MHKKWLPLSCNFSVRMCKTGDSGCNSFLGIICVGVHLQSFRVLVFGPFGFWSIWVIVFLSAVVIAVLFPTLFDWKKSCS